MRTMLVMALLSFGMLVAMPLVGQDDGPGEGQCNSCGYTSQCPHFDHWDNCGFGGPGLNFPGGCSPGCQELECIVHLLAMSEGEPDDGCDLQTELEALSEWVETENWSAIAQDALAGGLQLSSGATAVFALTCDGALKSQIPLSHSQSTAVGSAIAELEASLVSEFFRVES